MRPLFFCLIWVIFVIPRPDIAWYTVVLTFKGRIMTNRCLCPYRLVSGWDKSHWQSYYISLSSYKSNLHFPLDLFQITHEKKWKKQCFVCCTWIVKRKGVEDRNTFKLTTGHLWSSLMSSTFSHAHSVTE